MSDQQHLKEALIVKDFNYEELERTYWSHISVLLAAVSYFAFGDRASTLIANGDWALAIAVLISSFVTGWKYIAKKPYSKAATQQKASQA